MADCNATLITLTGTASKPVARRLSCDLAADHKDAHTAADDGNRCWWGDGVPGSHPHTPPLVTDAEVDAAWAEWRRDNGFPRHGKADLRAALEAAARVRQGDV